VHCFVLEKRSLLDACALYRYKGSCFQWSRGDLITRKSFDGSGRPITIT
jgi:hypothetical protein